MSRPAELFLLSAALVLVGGFNAVLDKIWSVPLKGYGFFVTLMNTVVYTAAYTAVVCVRLLVQRDRRLLRDLRWACGGRRGALFCLMGLLDGAGNVLSFVAVPYLSGPIMMLARQAIVLFVMAWAMALRGSRFTAPQILSVLVSLAGIAVAVVPLFLHGGSHSAASWYVLLIFAACVPLGASYVLREMLFSAAAARTTAPLGVDKPSALLLEDTAARSCEGSAVGSAEGAAAEFAGAVGERTGTGEAATTRQQLEVLVVLLLVCAWSVVWTLACVPINVLLGQTAGRDLGTFLADGAHCLFVSNGDCAGALPAYSAYISVNILYNVITYLLLRAGSATLMFVAAKAVLPFSVVLFLAPWPLLGRSPITPETWVSLAVVCTGVVGYVTSTTHKERLVASRSAAALPAWGAADPVERTVCCWPLACG